MIELKNKKQIEKLDYANKIIQICFEEITQLVKPGTTTLELDQIVERIILKHDATPAFKGYNGFPAASCISINDEVVHGIPSNRFLEEGDLVSVDVGTKYKGFFGDSARTFIVGKTTQEKENLVFFTKQALYNGIDAIKPGARLYDVNLAIGLVAEKQGLGNLRDHCGHGIGKNLHEDPNVFNYIVDVVPNIRIRDGMAFALEPMFTLGGGEWEKDNDGWTVRTKDGSTAAHWERSVALLDGETLILGG